MYRVVLSLLILGLLFYAVGIVDLLQVFARLDLLYVFLLLALSVVMIWASCLKWRLFIRAGGNDAPMLHLMKLYTVGYFFNTFTPSYVGGDAARSYHLGRYVSSQRDAFVATFLERFTGLLAMALLGMLFVAAGADVTAGLQGAILVVGLGAVLIAGACFVESLGSLSLRITKFALSFLGERPLRSKLDRLATRIDEGMQVVRKDPGLFLHSMFLSLLFHGLTVLNTYVAARSIGWENPSLSGLFIVVPLVLLVSMAPITPSGLGIQEGAFLFLLQRIGATRAEGLGVGLVLRAKVMVIALVGASLWLRLRKCNTCVGRTEATTSLEADDKN